MRKHFSTVIIILFGVAVFFAILWYEEHASTNVAILETSKPISVTFLDIGQGDATLIVWPNGTKMLVDCSRDSRILTALGRNMKFFDRTIDYLVATHPDVDHYGGCIDVLRRFTVKHIIYDGYDKEYDPSVRAFQAAVAAEHAEYFEPATNTIWSIESSTINFLYPDHSIRIDPAIPGNTKDTSTNNASVVFRLSYGTSDLLMTGDMETPLEEYLMRKYVTLLDTDILKVGHHGSAGSSGQAFLDLVTPMVATISAGAGNTYGHPTLRTLKRLEREHACIVRTDHAHDIHVLMYPDKIVVKNRCE